MGEGLCGLAVGVFVGVFAGALAYELLRKTGATRKIAESFRSAKRAFREGRRSAEQPAPESA